MLVRLRTRLQRNKDAHNVIELKCDTSKLHNYHERNIDIKYLSFPGHSAISLAVNFMSLHSTINLNG